MPAALKHQASVAGSVAALSAVGADKNLISAQLVDVESYAQLIGDLNASLLALDAEVEKAETEDLDKKAAALGYAVSDAAKCLFAGENRQIGFDGFWRFV